MQKYIAILLLLVIGHESPAQTISELQKDMYGIASDATEGRFTGSPGYLKAAKYVIDQLRAAGLQPGWEENGRKTWLQPVPFIWDDYTGSTIRIGGVVYPHSAENFIVTKSGKVRAAKWVVMGGGDWETTVIRQYRLGYMHYVPDGMPSRIGDSSRTGAGTDTPSVLISPTLARQLVKGVSVDVELSCTPRPVTGYNVVAIAPGTSRDPHEKVVIVGAHLDHIGRIGNHIYNGANDDASGCVAELSAAEEIVAKPCKRSVIFVFYCGEELNLKGSRWFTSHLPIEESRILMNINLEQVGSKHRSWGGLWALGDDQFRGAFYESGRIFSRPDLQFSVTDSVRDILSNTDSYSYMNRHIPSLLLGSGGFDEHHTTRDTIDLIDFDHLQKVVESLTLLVRELGNQ